VIRYGIAWRAMPNDLPPYFAVYQQAQRWLAATTGARATASLFITEQNPFKNSIH
jgi:hypothetical protein